MFSYLGKQKHIGIGCGSMKSKLVLSEQNDWIQHQVTIWICVTVSFIHNDEICSFRVIYDFRLTFRISKQFLFFVFIIECVVHWFISSLTSLRLSLFPICQTISFLSYSGKVNWKSLWSFDMVSLLHLFVCFFSIIRLLLVRNCCCCSCLERRFSCFSCFSL